MCSAYHSVRFKTANMLFDRRAKTAPSHYPRVLFHGLRTGQLVSSLIVGGIMSYFMYHLQHDRWKLPWTFIFVRSDTNSSRNTRLID